MQDPVLNIATVSVIASACVLSLAAGFYLFQRHVEGRALLTYEPRRRAPWGPLVLVIPLFFITSNFLPILGDSKEVVDQEASNEFFYGVLFFSILMIAFVPAVMAWLVVDRQADIRDLGLPLSRHQLSLDVCRGVVACLAALLPTLLLNYVLTVLLTQVFQIDQVHPLIDQLQNEGTTAMLYVGIVSAVVAAPLFEEFTFRVLLQGWLERVEDERIDFRATERQPDPAQEDLEGRDPPSELNGQFDAKPTSEIRPLVRPRHGWMPVLPHGWTPILISSVLFGLAHIGHGAAPVPLIFLGIVLGYLYQRTHRIAPCIVAHMVFNAYAMTLLWLSLKGESQ